MQFWEKSYAIYKNKRVTITLLSQNASTTCRIWNGILGAPNADLRCFISGPAFSHLLCHDNSVRL